MNYTSLLRYTLEYGRSKVPTREGEGEKTSTIGLPQLVFEHDFYLGDFPLVTQRPIAVKAMVGELRSFLESADNVDHFRGHGCKFWDPWAREDGDLGPIYGVQWSRHGQLAHVLKSLRESPNDRRMVVSAWRPDEHKEMVLPPCHVMWIVTPYDGELNLTWIQRSCDMPVGVPYNIASYGLLLLLLAKWSYMRPGKLMGVLCDAHIYTNQIEGVKEFLGRPVPKMPRCDVWFNKVDDFLSWDCNFTGYDPVKPQIKFPVEV